MKRTQIYLSEDQWKRLHQAGKEEAASVSDLIRKAIDRDLAHRFSRRNFEEALAKSFGLWKGRKDIRSSTVYVNKLRKSRGDRWHTLGIK